MQSFLWYLMFLSSVWFGSIVNGAAVLNNPSGLHLTNSTILINSPPDFTATLEETPPGPQISAIPCLNLAIKAVGEHLALEEFTEKIEAQEWSMDNVVIAVSTKWIPGHKIERRFVIWGIYGAFLLFEEQKSFRSAIFTLRWRGDPVGYLAIYPERFTSTDPFFNSPVVTDIEPPFSTIRGSPNNSVSSNQSSLEDRDLELKMGFFFPLVPLDIQSTLFMILGALCDAAQWPKNKVVPRLYIIRAGPSRTQIRVQSEGIMNYKWLIKAFTMTPEKMLSWETLDSFWVEIKLGTLKRGIMNMIPCGPLSDAPNAFIEAGLNVSVGSATAREK